ncbi:helix-turn-helix transcriptional regulator [Polluticoccus soli]|uniref:helix-turn-helix transcriptional regulator n=1 Tax=Polluticoccus soli TaxID=3034150 RepID=UPI0023E305A6|nr:response regulator transcription factor [Flavipsychrobacter sp. JY13-12]
MKWKLVLYGIILAALAIGLKLVEYKFVVRDHAIEVYGGIVAALFTILGIIAGQKLTRKKEIVVEKTVLVPTPMPIAAVTIMATDQQLSLFGISKREYEILQLMAEGLSNQEIADRTYVSLSTVKTHVSNILLKLDAKRRTQAVIKARELNLVG